MSASGLILSGENISNETEDSAECLAFSSDTKCAIIIAFRRTIGILSLLSCIFIVVVIVTLKKYKFLPQRLILYLTIATLFNTLHYCWADYIIANKARNGDPHLLRFCRFQGFYHILTGWIAFLWVCIITFTIFWITVFTKRPGKKIELFIYIPVDLTVPIILAIIPFFFDAYGPTGLWCWIISRKYDEDGESTQYVPGIVLQFTLYYGPWVILCIVMAVTLSTVYGIVHYRLSSYHGKGDGYGGPGVESLQNLWRDSIKPLMPFPWIYIATFLFPVINRLRLAADVREDDSPTVHFILYFLHAVTLPMPGLLFGFVFLFDRNLMRDFKNKLVTCYNGKDHNGKDHNKEDHNKEAHEMKETK